MFPTRSKAEFALVGPDLLRKLRGEIRVPLIGIGGITADNVQEVIQAGADGVAVISAVCAADDPRAASARFVALIQVARGLTAPRPPL
jgi:thiamine-phosphate pyrophosphorylase